MPTVANRRHSTPAPSARKRALFSVRAPSANAVYLAGSFNDWSPSALEMKCGDDGIWHAGVQLPPGLYEYKFVVDGRWCCDVTDSGPSETAEGCVPNDFGSMNRVVEVAP